MCSPKTNSLLLRHRKFERYSKNRVGLVVVVISVSRQAGGVCASFRSVAAERRNASRMIQVQLFFKERRCVPRRRFQRRGGVGREI